jgi:multiple sugar transport system permease protein/raffinose/stachyose/melibiose transport system permease protein
MDSLRRRINRTAIFLILAALVVVMLFPFVFMTLTSLRSYDQYLAGSGFSLDSWTVLFNTIPVIQELINSSVVTGSAVLLILIVSTMGGFAFAKLGYPGSAVIFLLILAGMMVPIQSIIIPEYVNLSRVHWIGQYYGAIFVYAALGAPFATYLMTTFYRGVSSELIEASLMDGASYWKIFLSVMIPLSTPAIVTVGVLQVIQIWDDFLIGLLFLPTPDVRTITVGLGVLQSSRMVNIPALMAGSLVSALPAIFVYLIFQRHLVRGLTMGMGR